MSRKGKKGKPIAVPKEREEKFVAKAANGDDLVKLANVDTESDDAATTGNKSDEDEDSSNEDSDEVDE